MRRVSQHFRYSYHCANGSHCPSMQCNSPTTTTPYQHPTKTRLNNHARRCVDGDCLAAPPGEHRGRKGGLRRVVRRRDNCHSEWARVAHFGDSSCCSGTTSVANTLLLSVEDPGRERQDVAVPPS
jgi:hypothetical protein